MESDKFADREKLQKAVKFFEVAPVVKRFGAWVVTTYGIECLETYYPIEISRVHELDWVSHMREKNWVKIQDFGAALEYARDLLTQSKTVAINGRPPRLFLCHGSEDKPTIRELRHQLLAIGTKPWLDEEELFPGQDWKLEITRAIQKSDLVLVCLSSNTVSKSGVVQREIKEALAAASKRPGGEMFIIPARLDDCILPESLEHLQSVDLFRENGFERLVQSLKRFSAEKLASSKKTS